MDSKRKEKAAQQRETNHWVIGVPQRTEGEHPKGEGECSEIAVTLGDWEERDEPKYHPLVREMPWKGKKASAITW